MESCLSSSRYRRPGHSNNNILQPLVPCKTTTFKCNSKRRKGHHYSKVRSRPRPCSPPSRCHPLTTTTNRMDWVVSVRQLTQAPKYPYFSQLIWTLPAGYRLTSRQQKLHNRARKKLYREKLKQIGRCGCGPQLWESYYRFW